MALADYDETYIDGSVRRNIVPRPYEEIDDYENEERTIGGRGPPSPPAMPPPQLLRNLPQQDVGRSHEVKKYRLKWLIAAFVIVSVIFAGMLAAVFVMITTVRKQGESHKFPNQNEAEYLRQASQNRMTRLENRLKEVEKSNTRYDELLAKQGWAKLSNGLHYKVLVWKNWTAFAVAENECKTMGARLGSTGIRNATIRREISSRLSWINEKYTWIGLDQPYGDTTGLSVCLMIMFTRMLICHGYGTFARRGKIAME